MPAQSVLTFPRVIATSDIFTGIAVGNPSSAEATVTFTAYQPNGAVLSGGGVANPVTVRIPAGGQYARLFPEIFVGTSFNGWVQATSGTSGLTGFALNGNNAITDLDGAGAAAPTTESFLPLIAEDNVTRTEISVVNGNPDAASVTLTLYSSGGSVLGTKTVPLPARGLMRQTLGVIFGSLDFSVASHVRVKADRPVVAHEVVADFQLPGTSLRRETGALAGQVASDSTRYILPQFASGASWLSVLGLVNASGVGQELIVTAYKDDGTPWPAATNPKRLSLDPNAGVRATVGDFFGFPSDTLRSGWIEVRSSLGYLNSYIGYGNSLTPSFALVQGTPQELGSRYAAYSHVAEGVGYYTGLTVVNPGAEPATLEFYTVRPDGSTIGKSTLTLGPNEHRAELFRELLAASLQQAGGWGYLRASKPVVSAVLFGSSNGFALANVPQQPLVADYVPLPQTTGVITGTVRSGGVGIGGIQVALSGPVNTTQTTDDSGRYIFSQLPTGSYRVAATRPGATVAPAERIVAIDKQNVEGIDFTAGGLTSANAPTISFVSPSAAFVGSSSFSLKVLGTNFTPLSVVRANTQTLATAYVSSVELQAVMPSTLVTQAGTIRLAVETPPPGGGRSADFTFSVAVAPSDPLLEGRASVGQFPAGVAIDESRHRALVTNQSGDSVTVIDLATRQQVAEIKVGRNPDEGIDVDPVRDIALVSNAGSNDVSVIDLKTNTVIKTIKVGRFPIGVAVNSTTRRAFVVNSDDNNVTIIDLNTLDAAGVFTTGDRPSNIALNASRNQAVVTNRGANTASIVDLGTGTTLAVLNVGQFPRGVAVDPAGNRAVVVNTGGNSISVIDLISRSVVATLPVGTAPTAVGIHIATGNAIVSNSGVTGSSTTLPATSTATIYNLDTRELLTSVPTGSAPFGLAVDQSRQTAVIANFGSNDVSIIRMPNPRPRISSIEPKVFSASGGAFTVTVRGLGFVPSSVVTLNGNVLPTTFVSSSELRGEVAASVVDRMIQVSGISAGLEKGTVLPAVTPVDFSICVTTPAPGGGECTPSADSKLQLLNAVPLLLSLAPTEIQSNTTDLVLQLSGNNFNATSIVNFGGLQFSPTASTSSQITIVVPRNQLTAGTVQVSVTNPSPGGGSSSTLPFSVNAQSNPTPAVISVSPASIAAGAGAVTVTVQGTGFIPGTSGSLAGVGGTVSGNSIVFALTATQTNEPGTLTGSISNPSPGGGSAAFSVNVVAQPPTFSGVTPATVAAGSAALPIVVTGTNFRSGSRIQFAGTPIPTIFRSATELGGTIPAEFLRRSGSFRIGVSNPPPDSSSVDGASFDVTGTAPVLTGITPAQAPVQTTPFVIQLTGSGFAGNSAAFAGATRLETSFDSATSLTVTLPGSLMSRAATLDITVTTPAPGGGTSSARQFRVVNRAPVITNVSPTSFRADAANVVFTVTGSNFVQGATIQLGARVLTTTFVSDTQLTAPLPTPYPLGRFDLTVNNPAPSAGSSNAVEITIAALTPTISAVTPSPVTIGSTITVQGTNFGNGSNVLLRGTQIPTNFVSPTQLGAVIPLGAATGSASLTVENPGPLASDPFTINLVNPLPVMGSIFPSTVISGVDTTVSVTGGGFVAGSQVLIDTVPVATVFVSSTALQFTTPPLSGGAHNIAVSNPAPGGGTSGSQVLTVTLPVPVLSSLSPSSGTANSQISLTVTGSDFLAGAAIVFGGTSLPTTYVSSSMLVAPVTLPVTPGVVNVLVSNPGPVVSNTLPFTVTGLPQLPTLTSILPSVGAQGQVMSVTLTGTNFINGGTAVSVTSGGVTASAVNVTSPSSLTATFTIAGNATLGAYSVSVSTAGGTSGVVTFTVTPPSVIPTISSINPGSGLQGQVVPVTLTGTNFVIGATTVNVSPTGVSAGTATVSSPTSLTVNLTIAGNATFGNYNVSVTTAGGTSSAVSFAVSGFTITAQAPVVGTIAGGQRTILSGTNIPAGPLTVSFGGVLGSGAQRLSATQLAVFTPPHVAGPVDVVVTAGPQSVTRTSGYTFNAGLNPSAFFSSGSLGAARSDATMSFLGNDVGVVMGGVATPGNYSTTLATSELRDPVTRLFTPGPTMAASRALHTSTTLGDGRVLVVGGLSGGTTAVASTEFLNSAGTAFTAGPLMVTARAGHVATLLADGRVLITGGQGTLGGASLNTVELFDPTSNTFSLGGAMLTARAFHQATLLADGRVLITGGNSGPGVDAEIYSPVAGSFVSTGSMVVANRMLHRAVRMTNGQVLITGGTVVPGGSVYLSSAEVFTGTAFEATTNSMPRGVAGHSASLLQNGRVLVAGGEFTGGSTTDAAVFEPLAATFGATLTMQQSRSRAAFGLAADGTVAFAGGAASGSALSSGEFYGGQALPVLSSNGIVPASRVRDTAAFQLDAFGQNFSAGSTILFNGHRLSPVTFLDSGHISIQIPATEISSTACSVTPCTFNVLVSNPNTSVPGTYLDSNAMPFAVTSPAISLSPNPVSVGTGGSVPIAVSVNQAPTSAINIAVVSGTPGVATVVTPATIAAGQTVTTVTVTGVSVGSSTITASLSGYSSGTTTVNVTAVSQPSVNVTPASISLNSAGTDTIVVSRANSPNNVNLDVSLSLSRTGYVNVPSVVTIPATQSSVVVPIAGIAPDPNPPVIVSASAAGHLSGTTSQISVQIQQIQITPALLVNPASSASLVITISSPAPNTTTSPCVSAGLCVSLVSSAPGIATVSSSALIPAGQTQTTALVNGVAAGNATVTASTPGFPSVTSSIQVQNVNLSFVPGAGTFFSGTAYAQTVTLIMSVPALSGGQTVNLSSSDSTVATVPASVIIPSGSTTVNLTITGVSQGSATITAGSVGLNSGTYAATVIAPTLLIDDAESVVDARTGVRLQHYARISGTAPIGGIPVTLTSSDPTKLLLAPCNTANAQSSVCNDTNSGQPSITLNIPTGQNFVYFDAVGVDTAQDEVRLNDPIGVAKDAAGNTYIAEYAGNRIRKIDAGTGIISTFAGNGTNTQTGDGGPANLATVGGPLGLAIYNNELYISAYNHHMIRKVNLATNVISTVVPSGTLLNPYQIALNSSGDLFIASLSNSRIYRFAGNVLSVYAGGGGLAATTVNVAATSLSLGRPTGVAVDAAGNVYYSDYDNHIVNQIAVGGTVTRVAGNGTCATSGDLADAALNGRLCNETFLAIDPAIRALYIMDRGNNRIVRVTLNVSEPSASARPFFRMAGGNGSGCCGDGLQARSARMNLPDGMTVDSAGNILFGDRNNDRVRQVTVSTGIIDTIAGSGVAGSTGDGTPARSVNILVAAPTFVSQRAPVDIGQSAWSIVSLGTTQTTGVSFTFTARSVSNDRMASPTTVTMGSSPGGFFTASPLTIPVNSSSVVFTVTPGSTGSGQILLNANSTRFTAATSAVVTVLPVPTPGLSIDDAFSVQDTATGVRRRHYVRLPSAAPTGGVPVTLTVQGTGVQVAQCNTTISTNSTCDGLGTLGSSTSFTVPAGSNFGYFDLVGGANALNEVRLNYPEAVAVDSGGAIYVADASNYRVRKLSDGVLTTVAGNGSSTASFGGTALTSGMNPGGITVDGAGNLYVASKNGHVVYQVTPGGAISIVAGTQGTAGFAEGIPGTGRLYSPYQVSLGPDGSLYIADYNNQRVRKVLVGGAIMSTIAGGGATTPAPGVVATAANLNTITGVVIDPATNDVYFSEYSSHRVWKVAQSGPSAGQLELVAGTGAAGYNGDQADATLAQLYYPGQLAISNGFLYIGDQYNHRIRRVTLGGVPRPLVTVAGTTSAGFNGDGDSAIVSQLYYPFGVAADSSGNVFIADDYNHRIREVLASNQTIQTVIGSGTAGFSGDGGSGLGTTVRATVTGPNYRPVQVGVTVQQSQWQIQSLGTTQNTSSTFTFTVRQANGDRMAANTNVDMVATVPTVFTVPAQQTINNNQVSVVVTATALSLPGNGQVQLQPTGTSFLGTTSAVVTVLPVSTPSLTIDDSYGVQDTATGARRRHYVRLPAAAPTGGLPVTVSVQGPGVQVAQCNTTSPTNSTCDGLGTLGSSTSFTVPAGSNFGYFDLIGGSGARSEVRLYYPEAVALDNAGAIYVADASNYRVRKLEAGVLSTIAGNGSSSASLGGTALTSGINPGGVTVDSSGNVYISSKNGHVIYKVTPGGAITVVAGTQGAAGFAEGNPGTGRIYTPYQVSLGPDGSLYIADYNNQRVRKVTAGGTVLSTVAGGGVTTPANGVVATSANLSQVTGVVVDPATGDIYFSEYGGHRVWRIPQAGPSAGQLEVVAGTGVAGYNGDQPDATLAQVYYPGQLAISNGFLFIADQYNHRIRRVTLGGLPRPLVTIAGTTSAGFNGDGDAAIVSQLYYPFGVAADASGNVFVADDYNHRIREVLVSNQTIQTVIGSGTGGFAGDGDSGLGTTIRATVTGPNYRPVEVGVSVAQSQWQVVSLSTAQNTSSTFTFVLRATSSDRMAANTTVDLVSTVPGVFTVPAQQTITNNLAQVVVTATTSSTPGNGQIQIQPTGTSFLGITSPVITVLPVPVPLLTINDNFGTQDTATGVRQQHYVRLPATVSGSPVTVNVTSSDASRVGLALCNATNHQSSTCTATTPTGAGISLTIPVGQNFAYFDMVGLTSATSDPQLYYPEAVAVDGSGAIYVADASNYRVRKLSGGVLTTIAGNGSSTSSLGGTALTSGMNPGGVTVDSSGNVYVASKNGHVIFQVTPGGAISVVAGSLGSAGFAEGNPGTGRLYTPYQVSLGPDGSLYIADYNNQRVRKIAAGGTALSTVAGGGVTTPATGVTATAANLAQVTGVVVDPATNDVYLSEYGHRVWRVPQTGPNAGLLELVAGTGSAGYNGDQPDATTAQIYYPGQLAISNGYLFIADQYNHRIRRVTLGGVPRPLVTIAGAINAGFNGDGNLGIVSQLYYPFGVAADATGNVFIADDYNHRVREVLASNQTMQTVIGSGTGGFAGDGLPGRGVTLNAAIAPGGPNYLPVTVSSNVAQSSWQFVTFPTTTSGPTFNFTVRQTSAAGSAMRMNSDTTFSVTPANANVFSLPGTLTIVNNAASVIGTATTIGSGASQIIAQASATGVAIGASTSIQVTPVVTSIAPSSSAVRNTVIPVVITGRNLLGATGISAATGITANITSVSTDGTTMNVDLTVGTSVTAGAQTLTVNTPTGTATTTFTVN